MIPIAGIGAFDETCWQVKDIKVSLPCSEFRFHFQHWQNGLQSG